MAATPMVWMRLPCLSGLSRSSPRTATGRLLVVCAGMDFELRRHTGVVIVLLGHRRRRGELADL